MKVTDYSPACMDCSADVRALGEIAYMVRRSLWVDALRGRTYRGPVFLCVGCLEARVGRPLDRHDFALYGVNLTTFGIKSPRLVDRLGDFDLACGTAARRSMHEVEAQNQRTRAGE